MPVFSYIPRNSTCVRARACCVCSCVCVCYHACKRVCCNFFVLFTVLHQSPIHTFFLTGFAKRLTSTLRYTFACNWQPVGGGDKHIKFGHYWPASITPSELCFAGGPIVAWNWIRGLDSRKYFMINLLESIGPCRPWNELEVPGNAVGLATDCSQRFCAQMKQRSLFYLSIKV